MTKLDEPWPADDPQSRPAEVARRHKGGELKGSVDDEVESVSDPRPVPQHWPLNPRPRRGLSPAFAVLHYRVEPEDRPTQYYWRR